MEIMECHVYDTGVLWFPVLGSRGLSQSYFEENPTDQYKAVVRFWPPNVLCGMMWLLLCKCNLDNMGWRMSGQDYSASCFWKFVFSVKDDFDLWIRFRVNDGQWVKF